MSLRSEMIDRLHHLGLEPKKSLGQNFLINPQTIDRIISRVQKNNPESIVEVGPGLGSLTDQLLQLDKPLKLIELDKGFSKYWREKNCDVTEGDALKIEWKDFIKPSTCLVSNLPYQISSSLVIERSFDRLPLSEMVLMFQKEVAERILSPQGVKAYGVLSVIAQSFWKIDKVLDAGPRDFYPAPKVASQVLGFAPKGLSLGEDYLSFVKMAFSQRRKMLVKNLKGLLSSQGLETPAFLEFIKALGYGEKVRAEEIKVEHYQTIFGEFLNRG